MEETINILMENFLIESQKKIINKEARAKLLKQLLKNKNCSLRQLSRDLHIPFATLHYWLNLDRDLVKEYEAISFSTFLIKLKRINPKTFKNWGRLTQIKETIIDLEQKKPLGDNNS